MEDQLTGGKAPATTGWCLPFAKAPCSTPADDRSFTARAKDGAFELVDVKLGPLAESKSADGEPVLYYPVLGGLSPGDEVVVQGGFLLDSQRQLEGMPSLLYEEGDPPRAFTRVMAATRPEAATDAGQVAHEVSAMPSGHKH